MGLIEKKHVAIATALFLAWRIMRMINSVKYTWKKSSKITSPIVAKLLKSCPHYFPPFWLFSGMLQTISTEFIRVPKLKFRREDILLPEMTKPEGVHCCPPVVPKGHVSVDWLDVESDESPIVILIPGLTGASSSGYVCRMAKHLHDKYKFRVACLNPRSRGGNDLVTPFLYSVGYTQDLRRIIEKIRDEFPRAPLLGAGFSLGSNVLAKLMGEYGDKPVLCGAACLACPVDCLSISNSLGTTFIGHYVFDPLLVGLVQTIRKEIEHILHEHPDLDIEKIRRAKTMHDFDHALIAPMFNFATASDYYRFSSSGLVLSKIRRPVLFIHAKNDPIVPGTMIKMDNFYESEYLISVMTKEGGHSMDWPQTDLTPFGANVVGNFFEAILAEPH